MPYKALLAGLFICFQCISVFAGPPEELTKTSIQKAFATDHISKKRHPGKSIRRLPKISLVRHPAATYEVPCYNVTIKGVTYFARVHTKRFAFSVLNRGTEQDELTKRNVWLDVYYDRHRKDHPNLPKFARFKKHIAFQYEGKDWEILIFEKTVGQPLGELLWDVAQRDFATNDEKSTQMKIFAKMGQSLGEFHFSKIPPTPYRTHGELNVGSIFYDPEGGVTLTNYDWLSNTQDGCQTECDFNKLFDLHRNFAHFKGNAWQRASHRYETEHPHPKKNKEDPGEHKTVAAGEIQKDANDGNTSSSSSTIENKPSSNAVAPAPAAPAHDAKDESRDIEDVLGTWRDAYSEYCNDAKERCAAQYKECLQALIDGYNGVRLEEKLPAIKIDLDYLR